MSEVTITAAAYEQFLGEKKIMASKCKRCGVVHLPPRPICPDCSGDEMEWQEVEGKGKLVAYTVIGVGPLPMINAGYGRDNPYCAGIIELEGGLRISGQILGVDVSHPENIKIGTLVVADFVERGTWALVGELAQTQKTYLAFRAQ